jgi:hypothetical protein
MTRRQLLHSAPFLLTAAKGQSKKPTTGQGEHTYEMTHDFLQLPEKLKFGNTHGIVVDAQGRIIVAHTVHKTSESPDAIAIFDSSGKFIKSWGADMRGGAHGLVIRKEGAQEVLYICDNVKGFVRKTTLDGEVIWALHSPVMSGLYPKASEYKPSTLAVAPNGDFFVADGYGKFFIHHYDANTNYIRTFGGSRELMNRDPKVETAMGSTIWPHAVGIDTRNGAPQLMIGERGANSRVQYFSLDGRPQSTVKEGVRWPSTFDFQKGLMLMPDLKAVVTIYNHQNKPIAVLGDGMQLDGKTYEGIRDKERDKFTPGKFIAPHAACFEANGDILVAEWVEVGRVTKLRKVGA